MTMHGLGGISTALLTVSAVQVCMIITQSNGYKALSGVPSLVW